MKARKKQIKQVSFRLYDTPRDRKISKYLESLQENQAEYLRRLVEQQMSYTMSEQLSEIIHTEPVKRQMSSEGPHIGATVETVAEIILG